MFRTVRIFSTSPQDNAFGRTFHAIPSQPGWITRAALLTAFIIIGLPILLLALIALFAGIVVFGVLAALNVLMARLRGQFRSDGRANVRVIQRTNPWP